MVEVSYDSPHLLSTCLSITFADDIDITIFLVTGEDGSLFASADLAAFNTNWGTNFPPVVRGAAVVCVSLKIEMLFLLI